VGGVTAPPFVLATVCAVLTVLELFLSPPGAPVLLSAANRSMGVAVFWAAVVFIARRLSAEAALRDSEARLRLSAEAANVGLWDWDLRTNAVVYSPEWKRQIVQLIAEGRSSKEVADRLHVSVKTAETHRANLMQKLGLHSVSELVRYAIRNKIVEA
jgi:DNA-binding NarL/FixJ family response regulator